MRTHPRSNKRPTRRTPDAITTANSFAFVAAVAALAFSRAGWEGAADACSVLAAFAQLAVANYTHQAQKDA